MRKLINISLVLFLSLSLLACSSSNDSKVTIYTNADEEAINIMKETLDSNDFKDKYDIQSFGSSELMAKVELENKDTKATNLGFSTFYLESLQNKYQMFKKHGVDVSNLLEQYQSEYFLPFLVNTGSMFYNSKVLEAKNLPVPKSLKDLANPVYKNQISFPKLSDSTTGWLLVQALLDNYSLEEAKTILKGIKENAGSHIESSGSSPIKKVEAGEVAIGFGLRHQAVLRTNKGLPIVAVDPSEGNYTLTESFAIISDSENAKKAIVTLFEKAHDKMLKQYPSQLFKTDKIEGAEKLNVKTFKTKLSQELLKEHIAFYESAK